MNHALPPDMKPTHHALAKPRGTSSKPPDGTKPPDGVEAHVPLAGMTTLGLGGCARWFAAPARVQDIVDICDWARGLRGNHRASPDQGEDQEEGQDRGVPGDNEGVTKASKSGSSPPHSPSPMPVTLLGGGSNVVIPDDGIGGLVLQPRTRDLHIERAGAWARVHVEAGRNWDELVQCCLEAGIGALAALSGIPGSCGATPVQNVGAYGQEISDFLSYVDLLDLDSQKIERWHADACALRYRDSRFKQSLSATGRDRWLILAIGLTLPKSLDVEVHYPALRAQVGERTDGLTLRQAVLETRASKSMVLDASDPNTRSAGSFFRNPVVPNELADRMRHRHPTMPQWPAAPPSFTDLSRVALSATGLSPADPAAVDPATLSPAAATWVKIPAAWLIEQAGIAKGFRMGPVGVSSHHALALVHFGGGSSKALHTLAAHIQTAVHAQFGITLEAEPRLLFPACDPPLLSSAPPTPQENRW